MTATIRNSIVALLLAVVSFTAIAADEPPTRTLTIRDQKLQVELATTPETRALGLMNRFSLRTDHGMLFVFEAPQPLAFYMKNTYVPLSIAFRGQPRQDPQYRGHAAAGRVDALVEGHGALRDRNAARVVRRQRHRARRHGGRAAVGGYDSPCCK